MELNEIKNVFLELLRACFQADEQEELILSEKTLEENGLSGDTFWDIVCPSLKKEGVLREYNNPNSMFSDFSQSVLKHPEHSAALGNPLIADSRSIARYEHFAKTRLPQLEAELRKSYRHKFIVNGEKLLAGSSDVTDTTRGSKRIVKNQKDRSLLDTWKYGSPKSKALAAVKLNDRLSESADVDKKDRHAKRTPIYYNTTTGVGKNKGKSFKLKDGSPEYKVFKYLYTHINTKMERYDVLIQCGFYEDGEHIDPARKTSETSKINALVKNLRDKTLLDTENLVNNSGNLTLVGEKVEEAK